MNELSSAKLIGTNTLLYGGVGSGKTSTLPTFIAAGVKHKLPLKLAVIITEPGGVETLLDGMERHAKKVGLKTLPMDRLFYRYIPPSSLDWNTMKGLAEKVNLLTYSALSDQKAGVEKNKNKQFIDIVVQLSNFADQHGELHGDVTKFDHTWMVAIDSLSGINKMALRLMCGYKPTPHQGEWGTAMSVEESLIDQFVASTKCFTCLCAHYKKNIDALTGKPDFQPDFLGNKLDAKVPRMFSDVVLQTRDDKSFHWSTIRPKYESLKARNLPQGDKLPPDFTQIVETWLKREKAVGNLANESG